MSPRHNPEPISCATPRCDSEVGTDAFPFARFKLGYKICLGCGDLRSAEARRHWTVIQQYGKGPYQLVTPAAAPDVLRGTNQKQVRT
jgi:hypothetical protein